MTENPMLNKMDALLKKHRGSGETDSSPPSTHAPSPEHTAPAEPMPPPGAWLPVLTDVIERGTPPTASRQAGQPAIAPAAMPVPAAAAVAPAEGDAIAEHLLGELTPRLSEAMEKQVAAELRKNLDQTVANLLSQLDVNVRDIVRDAVAEKLKQPHDPST